MNQRKALQNAIDYYERLLNARISTLENEEVELLLSERDSIHDLLSYLAEEEILMYEKRIRTLDLDLISQINTIDLTVFNHPEYPPELWWWHLHELNELTDEQKSTL